MDETEFTEAIANIRHLAAISVRPGEVVWARVDDLTPELAEQVSRVLRGVFPDNKVIVTPPQIDLELVEEFA